MTNAKKRVVIIGGGFAGRAAASRLQQRGDAFDITLLDKKATSDFLPLLPDILSARIETTYTMYDLNAFEENPHTRFVQAVVTDVDTSVQTVQTRDKGSHPYDYLIMAAGTETTFFGNNSLQNVAYQLDNTEQAVTLREAAEGKDFENVVVVGGGYTGIEIATHLDRLFREQNRTISITIVELASQILSRLPERIRTYTERNLGRLSIDTVLETTIQEAENGSVTLTDGKKFQNALLVWSPGVKAPDMMKAEGLRTGEQHRLKVNRYMQAGSCCFAAGDCALVKQDGVPLRPSVQFALQEGTCAAENLIRAEFGKPMRPFKPLDLGYVIPMANNRSTGKALGIPVRGLPATALHYLMCMLRSPSAEMRWGILCSLFHNRASQ